MPYAKDTYSGDGATTDFNITFPYLDESHVLATVGGVSTAFTFLTATTARFATAPATGTNNVIIRRETKQDGPLVDFQNGSTPVESDLDTSGLQTLYLEQERDDIEGEFIRLDTADDKMNAQSKVIKNVADGTTNDEAVNFSQLNAVVVGGNGVPNPANPGDDDKVLTASGGTWSWVLNPKTLIASITDITFSNIRTFLAATSTSGARAAIEAAGTAVANTFTANQTIRFTDDGAGAGPALTLDRVSNSAAAADLLGRIDFRGRDGSGGSDIYAVIGSEIEDAAATSEDGHLFLQTIRGGTRASRLSIRDGLATPGATGGDQGVDTINASEFYEDGVLLDAAIAATQAEMETGSSLVRSVTPGRQQHHLSACKVWCQFDASSGTPSIDADYNVTSITDNGVGDFALVFTDAFSSANYCPMVGGNNEDGVADNEIVSGNEGSGHRAAGSYRFQPTRDPSSGSNVGFDATAIYVHIFGDQ